MLGEYFGPDIFCINKLSVSVITTLTAGFLGFGTTLYALIFLYFFFANAFFLVSELYAWHTLITDI